MQPVSDASDDGALAVVVRPNVLARDVRYKLLISIGLAIENEQTFTTDFSAAVSHSTNKDAQLQRHIETRKLIDRVEPRSGNIMDTEVTLPNQSLDFFKTILAAIFGLKRATRAEATIVDCKNNRPLQRDKFSIERTIDEDIFQVHQDTRYPFWSLNIAANIAALICARENDPTTGGAWTTRIELSFARCVARICACFAERTLPLSVNLAIASLPVLSPNPVVQV